MFGSAALLSLIMQQEDEAAFWVTHSYTQSLKHTHTHTLRALVCGCGADFSGDDNKPVLLSLLTDSVGGQDDIIDRHCRNGALSISAVLWASGPTTNVLMACSYLSAPGLFLGTSKEL